MKKQFIILSLLILLIGCISCDEVSYKVKTKTVKNGGSITFISDLDDDNSYCSCEGKFLNQVFVGTNILIAEIGPVNDIEEISTSYSDLSKLTDRMQLRNGYGYILIPTLDGHRDRAIRMYVRFTKDNKYYVQYQEIALANYPRY